MKKIKILVFTFVLMFMGVITGKAATLNINDVSEKFNDLVKENDLFASEIISKVNTTDKRFEVYSGEDIAYSMTYGDDYLEYENRSVELTKENCVEDLLTYIFLGNTMQSIFELSGYTNKTLNDENGYENNYDTYGLQLEAEHYSFSETLENGGSSKIEGDFIRYVKISLDTEKIDALMKDYGKDIEEEPKTPLESLTKYLQDYEYYFWPEEITNVDISSDGTKLSVKLTTKEKVYETEYSYKDGILSYTKKGSKYYDYYINDTILIYMQEKFSYNMSKFNNYIYSLEKNNFNIETDGIEVTISELYDAEEMKKLEKELEEFWATLSEEEKKEREADGLDEVFNPLIVTELKLDIENGLKTYDESKVPGYNVIKGGYEKYEVGKTEYLTFKINAEFELLDSVYIDGKLVDKTNYEAKSGSTVITLKKEYLDKLSNGEHILKVTFKDGDFAESKFSVEIKNVSTGVNLGYGVFALIILISGIGYFLIRKQSKFPKYN